MSNIRKFDYEQFHKEAPQRNLRQAAQSYLHTAIQLYIKIEAKVSVWDSERFGDSANIVCSLNRAIEHLLKLRLLKTDPLLLYPLPKKIEEYCHIKQITTKNKKEIERRIKEREILAHTISFKEALSRVDMTHPSQDFNFNCFKKIYSLRNSLEHHWDRNEEFLQSVVGSMSTNIIPCIKKFIVNVLEENPDDYFYKYTIEEVERLDRALSQGHSLSLQKQLEIHTQLYAQDPKACIEKYHCPPKYTGLAEEDTESECPVCNHQITALWDWEADYDVEGSTGPAYIVGAFPDVKCLFCYNCHFFVEGNDISNYLPDGLEIEYEPDEDYC